MLPLLLCNAVAPAPQATSDSDITYVKPQPTIEAPTAPRYHRESRIENLPLTIPGNITIEGVDKNLTEKIADRSADDVQGLQYDLTLPESSNLSEITALPDTTANETTVPAGIVPEINLLQADAPEPEETAISEIAAISSTKPDETALPDQTVPEANVEGEELLEAHGSDVSDTIPSETYQSERRGRTYDSSETTDIFEDATERYEDITQIPEIEPRTRATPKFVPKLSYFQKPQVFVSFPTNSIEKSAKRRFRSHCRCEKIWNCPRLQISVPRCPNEYFLCCF